MPYSRIPESELILHPDGSVYHLGLRPEHLTDTILTVGDPERVPFVSRYFDTLEAKIQKREFLTHIGYLGSRRIMVISSGMGTDNVEILLTELDALANVDFSSRLPKDQPKKLHIIRIGTTGSLQQAMPVDSHLVSTLAFGLDTLMQFYPADHFSETEKRWGAQLASHLDLPFVPYCVHASEGLQASFGKDMIEGYTLTCPGFYAPQGRHVRISPRFANFAGKLASFRFDGKLLTNFEMETAGYYAMGRLLGHEVLSVNAILANRITHEFSRKPQQVIQALIEKILERLSS